MLLSRINSKNTMVMLGDSYTALHKGGSSPGTTTPTTGYFNWANQALNRKFHILNYAGIAGQTTAQIYARLYSDCINIQPSWAAIQGGINDINSGVTAATIYTNLSNMYDRCIENGICTIGFTIPLITAWSGNQANLNKANDVNALLKQYARNNKHFVLIDWNSVLIDQSTGIMKTAYTYDNTHLSLLGCAVAGDLIYNTLKYVINQVDMLPYSNNDEYSLNTTGTNTNLCPNPMLTGSTNGLATGWNPNVTLSTGGSGVLNTDYTQSKVQASGYRSWEWQQFAVLTASGAEKRFAFRPSTSAMAGRWNVGDYLYVECEFESDAGWGSASRFDLRLNTLVSSGGAPSSIDMFTNGTTNGTYPSSTSPVSYQPTSGVLRTYPVQMTSLVTSVYPELQFYAVSGVLRIGRFSIRKATPVTIGSNTVFLY